MLHILLMLLKIIGILILAILGLILLALGIVFFVPIKYCGTANIDKDIKQSNVHIKVSWLLHLVSGNVDFAEKHLTYEIRLFGKKLQLDKKIDDDVESEPVQEVEKEQPKEVSDKSAKDFASNLAKEITEEVIQDATGKASVEESPKKKKSVKKKRTKKESFLKKIKYTIQNICDKIKMIKQKKEEIESFLKNDFHKAAFKKLLKEFGKLLKSLRPKKLELNAHFGFEDPSLTGKILAALSMLYPFYGDNIRINPDFEDVIMEGDLYLKGRIRVIHAIKMVWNLVWDKSVRMTFKDILKWMK